MRNLILMNQATQSKLLVRDYNFIHLSAGDLLRTEMDNINSKDGEMIRNAIGNGSIVPATVTVNLLKNAMNASTSNHFLIDGFPRNMDNYHTFNKELGSEVNVPFVLYFSLSDEESVRRLLNRARTSGRHDDNEKSIKKRLKTFQEETSQVIDVYRRNNLLVEIDASQSVDKVYADLKDRIKDKI
eukprot:TRINITY_DN1646_c0_g1_i1.p1 TRINITY_DN1646_c0_g1~~TRINITY_DN1646_c0_g1_i1.p1  ORF type:complete len:185 (-),score=18.41 TRINITY_DN1646_c0_g1_i1:109-663(-)